MVQDCKYRLPCAWCDKHDRPCEAIEYEIARQKQKENLSAIKCDHNWNFHHTLTHTGGTECHYRCSKCGAFKVIVHDCYYESGEWQP